MKYSAFQLPDQNIPDSKKTKKWHIEHGNTMIDYINSEFFDGRIEKIREAEGLYNTNTVSRPTVTSPYMSDLGMEYETYPLVEGIIDDIIGKYLSRPLKKKVYSINKNAINSKLDKKLDYIFEDLIRSVNENLSKETGVQIESPNPELELPDDIEEFFAKSYKTNAEEVSDDIIKQFLEVNREVEKIKILLTQYLYGDITAAYIDEESGHPSLVALRYDECYHDINPEKEVQSDMDLFSFYKFYTENEIYNKFDLNKTDKQKVKETFLRMDNGSILTDPIGSGSYDGLYQNCAKGTTYKGWIENNSRTRRLRVLVMKWKSRRNIRSLSYIDKTTGKKKYKLLPDSYKERKRDNIEVTSVETIHFIKMLGPEIVLEWGETKERNSRIDDPSKANISAVALVARTYLKTNNLRSIAMKLKGLQTFASDILFQLRFAINQIEGKVMVYDAAQTPKQFIDTYGKEGAINRVLHHVKKDKLVVINTADKRTGKGFNQFTTLDLTNRGLIKDLVDALLLVEDLARKFTGLTKEAQEGGEKYQTATSVNRSIIASNSRIEVYFEPFDNFISAILNKVLKKAKSVYNEGQVFQQVFGDLSSKFMKIHKDFFDVDLGIYISDTAKEIRDKQIIDQGAQMALSSAQTPELILDLINVLEKDNASESKAILERSIATMSKLQEQQQQQAQELEQAKIQESQAQREFEATKAKESNAKDIEVAKIYANNKLQTVRETNTSDEAKKIAELELKQKEIEDKVNNEKQTEKV